MGLFDKYSNFCNGNLLNSPVTPYIFTLYFDGSEIIWTPQIHLNGWKLIKILF